MVVKKKTILPEIPGNLKFNSKFNFLYLEYMNVGFVPKLCVYVVNIYRAWVNKRCIV